jgi:hypothetical protein
MTDIVERLMDFENHGITASDRYYLRTTAATEIARLRALQSMAIEVIDASDDLTAENERLRGALERIADADTIMTARGFAQDALINQQTARREALDELTAETERLGLYDPPKDR